MRSADGYVNKYRPHREGWVSQTTGHHIKPSHGYVPGANSPIRQRDRPPTPPTPLDGQHVAREAVNDELVDLQDHEEWHLHRCGLVMSSLVISLIGVMMILMGRSLTPMFSSMKKNDILLSFGCVLQLPLVRVFVILFLPTEEERKRRREIRIKARLREKDRKGMRLEVLNGMYVGKIAPEETEFGLRYARKKKQKHQQEQGEKVVHFRPISPSRAESPTRSQPRGSPEKERPKSPDPEPSVQSSFSSPAQSLFRGSLASLSVFSVSGAPATPSPATDRGKQEMVVHDADRPPSALAERRGDRRRGDMTRLDIEDMV